MKQNTALYKARGNTDYRLDDRATLSGESAPGNLSVIGSDPELSQLNSQLGELQERLAKAERRIERLLGEKSQLKTLLDKRDDQIQRLNRELGTHHATRAPSGDEQKPSLSWRNVLASLLGRVDDVSEKVRARLKPEIALIRQKRVRGNDTVAKQADFGRPPLVANYKKVEAKAVLAVVLFGMDEGDIRALLPSILRDCKTSDMMALILTDNDAFEVLREQRLIFEYLPPAEDRQRFSRQLNWDLYVQRRLAIIRKKWQPTRVIALGQVSTDVLRLWQESPFEEFPLPASVRDENASIS